MRLDTLGQTSSHGVGDDITDVKLARELVPRFEEDGAPFPYVLVWGFNLTLGGLPFDRTVGVFHINTGHGGVSVDGDVVRDNFVEKLWALFRPNGKLVRADDAAHILGEEFGSGLADQPPDDLSDGKGADSAIGFGGRGDSRREICAEDLCWDVGSGESPEGFPHAVTWVSVEFGHPGPVLVPSTTSNPFPKPQTSLRFGRWLPPPSSPSPNPKLV